MTHPQQYVHVFAGQFPSHAEACLYSEGQWEPEPDDSASDEAYEAWENRNPHWQLKNDLGCQYLLSDFVETVYGTEIFAYLRTLLKDPQAATAIEQQAGPDCNTLVLVFSLAFAEFPEPTLASTPVLRYCGRYECELD